MTQSQERIYKYISFLCNGCRIIQPHIPIPVIITKEEISKKLNLSEMTVKRALEHLINEKLIYMYKINNTYIYSITEQDETQDMFVRVRVQ